MRPQHFLLTALIALPLVSLPLPSTVRAQEEGIPGSSSSEAAPSPSPPETDEPPEPQAQDPPAASPGPTEEPQPAATQGLPLATDTNGERPPSDPSVLPPAATRLPEGNQDLTSPAPLALPNTPSQVRIRELRPLNLVDVETIAEVNNPNLKALGLRVEQAQSALRAELALWYPQISLRAGSIPSYSVGEQWNSGAAAAGSSGFTSTSITRMQAALDATWAVIDPTRNPRIAAAKDRYEQAKNEYLIGLRELRLQANTLYFSLQAADDQVRIGQESVRASLVSLRDARARFQAGVATKLEVLEAQTQLARDEQLLTNALASQSLARRSLAALLDLPQDVTPTAEESSRVVGAWIPSLQESIIAAYAFREELDQILLNISIANSEANAQLGAVQPFLEIFNTFGYGRSYGYQNQPDPVENIQSWSVDNSFGLNFRWNFFDGGQARSLYRQQKQVAEENRFRFAVERDSIREEVEENFYNLERNNRNITTTSREVLSSRESLRLARLRFQAGVTTQREVVDTQRDLTQAEVRYANAISDYNTSLAQLRRLTGLDQIALCQPPDLPAGKPASDAMDIPVEIRPLAPACRAANLLTTPASGPTP